MKLFIFNKRELNSSEAVKPEIHAESTIRPNPADREPENDIDKLFATSRKGLWELLIFLAASIIAFHFRDQGLTSCLPADVREIIGPAPPMLLVNLVVWVSTLSSLVIIGGRILHGSKPGNTGTHLFFRLIFYLLYFATDSLADYYHAMFISGLVVLGLQHYNIWSYTSKVLDMKGALADSPPLFQKMLPGK